MFSKFQLAFSHSKIKTMIFLGVLLASNTILADQPPIDTGPMLGSQLPPLSVIDQFGDKQQLNNLMRKNGAVIVVFRSADWCPFCKRHLLELNDVVGQFKEKGYGVAAISYDSPKILRKFSQKKKLRFALLSDQQVQTFKAFDVVNIENEPGSRHYGIPYPGVIVVNKKGEVIHKYFFEQIQDHYLLVLHVFYTHFLML